jgi:hypothetical protein
MYHHIWSLIYLFIYLFIFILGWRVTLGFDVKSLVVAKRVLYHLSHTFSPHNSLKRSFFVALRFELRTYTLNHSTSPIFVMGFFEIGSHEPALNHDLPDHGS